MDMQTQIPLEAAWETMMSDLQAKVGEEVFSSWFNAAQLTGIKGGKLQFSVPQLYIRNLIYSNYKETIDACWPEGAPSYSELDIRVRKIGGGRIVVEDPETPRHQLRPAPKSNGHDTGKGAVFAGAPLDSRYTFDTFVEGPANRLALAAAGAVAESTLDGVKYNPLIIHSAPGLGKTHLLQAMAQEISKQRLTGTFAYLSAERFLWHVSQANKNDNLSALRNRWSQLEVLLLDDLHLLQGKSIQEEVNLLIKTLLDNNKQLVITSDIPPSELLAFDKRTLTRLEAGWVSEIGPLDYEIRLAILKQRLTTAAAEDESLTISEPMLEHIASTSVTDGRELENVFSRLLLSTSCGDELTQARVNEVVRHRAIETGGSKKVRIEDIQRVVGRHYNVSKTELLSNRRTRTIVKPRQVAMYLSKTMTPRSLPEIGRRFGGRDHTTVLHAVRKIEGLSESDNTLAQELELLKRLIREAV